jgi:hypothetical protein
MYQMICSRCVYAQESVFGLSIDDEGVCNYCHQIQNFKKNFGTGTAVGITKLEKIINEIKQQGIGKNFDCVVGVSGGTDSSYLLLKSVEWGLRPLAVHYDNTGLASENIFRITKKLGVPLETFVVDNIEVDEIKRSFLRAAVPEFDADTDIAFVQILRQVAAENNLKYILEGHSFQTEGVSPLGGNYLDGGYIKDIIKHHAEITIRQFPNMSFLSFVKWITIKKKLDENCKTNWVGFITAVIT